MSYVKKSKNYEIDADYQSVFADGIMLSVEANDSVKMIFFENTYKFDPHRGYDKENKVSRLKFEVRMTMDTLNKLSTQLFNTALPSHLADLVKIKGMHQVSGNVIKEIDKLSDDISETVFDTDNPIINERIDDAYNAILGRMAKEENETTDE